MEQNIVMSNSFVFVLACVFMTILGMYLRSVCEVRRGRRSETVDTEELEKWTQAEKLMKRVLWVLAPVLGLALLLSRSAFG